MIGNLGEIVKNIRFCLVASVHYVSNKLILIKYFGKELKKISFYFCEKLF